MFNKSIVSFEDNNSFLSNFYIHPILFENVVYKSSEHAYQAQKTLDHEEIKLVREASTPEQAKKIAQTVTLREGWGEMRVDVMRDVLWAKFSDAVNPKLANKLINTKKCFIIKDNNYGDVFWGMCEHKGENMFGKLLMEIRDELKNS